MRLWDVIEFFGKGGERNPFLDAKMKPLGLTPNEVDDLVNFLSALTSDRSQSCAPQNSIASVRVFSTAKRYSTKYTRVLVSFCPASRSVGQR